MCVMAQRIYSINSGQTRRRSRRTDRLGGQRADQAEHAVAASSTRPGRNIVHPCRPIPARTVRTVRRPKCARRRRWSRHPGAAGAARVFSLRKTGDPKSGRAGDDSRKPSESTSWRLYSVPGKIVAQLTGHAKVDTTLTSTTPRFVDGSLRRAADAVGSELSPIVHNRKRPRAYSLKDWLTIPHFVRSGLASTRPVKSRDRGDIQLSF